MHALTPFVFQRRPAPYEADDDVWVVPVTCKTDLGVARKGAVVHRIRGAAAVLGRDRIRYGARWACGAGSNDVALLANADAHGGEVCRRCLAAVVGFFVYRCYAADGRLLYIGATGNIASRLATHASQTSWWSEVADTTREEFSSLPAARAAERLAIAAEKPERNRQWAEAS